MQRSTQSALLAIALVSLVVAVPSATAVCSGSADPSERCLYPDTGSSDGQDDTLIGPVQSCPQAPTDPLQGGIVPALQWYSERVAYRTCVYGDDWEDMLVDGGGDVAHAVAQGGSNISAFALAAPGGPTPTPSAVAFVVLWEAVHVQQAVQGVPVQGQVTTQTYALANDLLLATDCVMFGPNGDPLGVANPHTCS